MARWDSGTWTCQRQALWCIVWTQQTSLTLRQTGRNLAVHRLRRIGRHSERWLEFIQSVCLLVVYWTGCNCLVWWTVVFVILGSVCTMDICDYHVSHYHKHLYCSASVILAFCCLWNARWVIDYYLLGRVITSMQSNLAKGRITVLSFLEWQVNNAECSDALVYYNGPTHFLLPSVPSCGRIWTHI